MCSNQTHHDNIVNNRSDDRGVAYTFVFMNFILGMHSLMVLKNKTKEIPKIMKKEWSMSWKKIKSRIGRRNKTIMIMMKEKGLQWRLKRSYVGPLFCGLGFL